MKKQTQILYAVFFLHFFQLFVFGQTLALDEENRSFSLTGQCNIYLPYLNLLNQVTSRIGKWTVKEDVTLHLFV